LRRYRVVYPSIFQNTGQVVTTEPTEADQVYVSDRLVVNAGGTLTGNMIYGPKPCNFAWFDHEGVTNRTTTAAFDFQTNFKGTFAGSSSLPTYQATSSYAYTIPAPFPNAGVTISVNPDGRSLPNIDRDGAVGGIIPPSCSATISIYDELMGVPSKARLVTSYTGRSDKITLGTRDLYLNEIHINPLDPWSPDYVEDTSFQACVPVADPYLEPPLHFFRDATSNVAWCAKVYPTQNPYWVELNSRKKPLGALISNKAVNWTAGAKVSWFTSHTIVGAPAFLDLDANNTACTGTAVDKICEWSLGTTASADYNFCKNSYLSTFVGANTKRCDRSVMFDSNQDYRGFPLQAKDADIESMLKADLAKNRDYSCAYSVNSNQAKINKNQPLSNCCGMKAGVSILDTATRLPLSTGGHLEPYLNGAVPTIRFCGSPVE
jgi:hypothetical protein